MKSNPLITARINKYKETFAVSGLNRKDLLILAKTAVFGGEGDELSQVVLEMKSRMD